jgi:hypothetical protein
MMDRVLAFFNVLRLVNGFRKDSDIYELQGQSFNTIVPVF